MNELYYIVRFDFSEKEMNSFRWFRNWRKLSVLKRLESFIPILEKNEFTPQLIKVDKSILSDVKYVSYICGWRGLYLQSFLDNYGVFTVISRYNKSVDILLVINQEDDRRLNNIFLKYLKCYYRDKKLEYLLN